MDRFIAFSKSITFHSPQYLKSNMDRFIGIQFLNFRYIDADLKSNMDRFIVPADM